MKKIYRKWERCSCCWDFMEYDSESNSYSFFTIDEYNNEKLTSTEKYHGFPEDMKSCSGSYVNELEQEIKEMFTL